MSRISQFAALAASVAATQCALASVCTGPEQIYFSSRKPGEIIKSQYASSPYQVTISAINYVPSHPSLAVIFDSNKYQTYDPDLLYPWTKGNLVGKKLNELLVVANNKIDANGDGLIDNPNDEGGTPPAGELSFKFKNSIKTFGIDIVDMGDYPDEINKSYISFKKGTTVKKLYFSEFTNPASVFFDPTIVWGDHSANRIRWITSTKLGIANFTEVRVHLHDSAAIDNVAFCTGLPPEIPEPATLSLLATSAFLSGRRRRSPNHGDSHH
jgi:hypothetical protein